MLREYALRRSAVGLCAALFACGVTAAPASAAEEVEVPRQSWSFSAPFGTFDRGALQRGYKVYREACAACHGLDLLSFRNLGEPGGPEFTEGQVRALATEAEIVDGPDATGEMFTRSGLASDRMPNPFPNEQAARAANNGALPPDLSVMAKAREGGPDYIYALLIGYVDPPADFTLAQGMTYNAYFPGHQIAMPNPLADGMVAYDDETPETVENYARDVSTFLMWTAEPKLEERHRLGFRVLVYLALLGGFLYLTKRRIWARLDGH